MWADKLEKITRSLLWSALSVAFIGIPFAMASQFDKQKSLNEAVKKAEENLAAEREKKAEPVRWPFDISKQMQLSGIDLKENRGYFYFTNISPKAGVICLAGIATNTETNESTESLASCQDIKAYSSVEVIFTFASNNLKAVCGEGVCRLTVRSIPDIIE